MQQPKGDLKKQRDKDEEAFRKDMNVHQEVRQKLVENGNYQDVDVDSNQFQQMLTQSKAFKVMKAANQTAAKIGMNGIHDQKQPSGEDLQGLTPFERALMSEVLKVKAKAGNDWSKIQDGMVGIFDDIETYQDYTQQVNNGTLGKTKFRAQLSEAMVKQKQKLLDQELAAQQADLGEGQQVEIDPSLEQVEGAQIGQIMDKNDEIEINLTGNEQEGIDESNLTQPEQHKTLNDSFSEW